MKRLILILVLVGLAVQWAGAQTGHYFLSHYKPGNDNYSYRSFDIQQDKHGILYFANRSGVLQFDGRTWTMVQVTNGIRSLSLTTSGDVVAAGQSGFGKIGLNERNQLAYLSLSDSFPQARNILISYASEKTVYLLSETLLIKLDSINATPRIIFSADPKQGALTGLFEIGGQLYLSTQKEGLKLITGDTVKPAEWPLLANDQLVFSEKSPIAKTDFIGTRGNKFFLKRKNQPMTEFQPKDSVYLYSNVVANCVWVTERMVAIGTLRGGIVFVDPETGETLEISNYYAGLPDNEVYALLTDGHRGVWVAHDYGFSRVAPFLPFRTYSHYPGLSGNLLCVQSMGDQVYVGTTLGLYVLSKEETFEEVEYPVNEGSRGKGGKAGKTGRQNQKVKGPRVLKGIEYAYKPVAGISGKVDQLVVVEGKLLCGGVGGVFEIDGQTSIPVDREPVRTILYSKNLKQLLLSTYTDQIKAFRPAAKAWQQADFPDSLSVYADYLFEDNLQNLWICGRDHAVKVGIEEGEILDAESIPLPHLSIDRTVGLAFGNEVYLTQDGEFFHYASFKNSFVKYDSLPDSRKYFASTGSFWFYDGTKWRTIDRRLQGTMKTEWLKLFQDIRFLAPAVVGKSLWVIPGSNELYRFSGEDNENLFAGNPLFLKEVRGHEASLAPGKKLKVEERESALTFEFIQPDYLSFQAVEYRYWVKGLQTGWSKWSASNNVVNFPFLPPGSYVVQMQSKDLFGKVTEFTIVDLNVLPPFWKRWWFYALEFLFFGSLVVLSLRVKGINTRNRYLSRFLSALTVIMLIQFIQTVVASTIAIKSTPVADFFIQVFVALLVLPVEEFLRWRILRASEKSLQN